MEINNQNNIELIERFIDGNLSKEEQHNFNVRLEIEDEFAALYRFRLKIRRDLQKAKQYETTRMRVSGAIKKVQKQNRKFVIYAIAAGLTLLIAIPGVFTILNKPHHNNLAETDSTQTEVFEPQIIQPESYANQGQYVPGVLTLTVVQTNDSVIFKWEPALSEIAKLVVLNLSNGSELINTNISPDIQQKVIPADKLPSGKIIWYIEGFAARDSFEIR